MTKKVVLFCLNWFILVKQTKYGSNIGLFPPDLLIKPENLGKITWRNGTAIFKTPVQDWNCLEGRVNGFFGF